MSRYVSRSTWRPAMGRWFATFGIVAAAGGAAGSGPLRAQVATGAPIQFADASGPRFFAERPAGNPTAPLVDVRNAAVFRRTVVLALNGVTVAAAVDEIARQGHVQI